MPSQKRPTSSSGPFRSDDPRRPLAISRPPPCRIPPMTPAPIVLHHGLFGYDSVGVGKFRWAYFQGIDKSLRKLGHPLIVTRVHPTGGIVRRAAQLKAAVETALAELNGDGHGKILLVAHSMGGLDARYMLHQLGIADRVGALLTVTTPHRGSP